MHEDIKERLAALHDGEIGPAESAQLRAHLNACPECRASYQHWQSLARVFLRAPSLPQHYNTEAFVCKVLARLTPEESARPEASWPWASWRWLVPAMSFAVAVSAVLIAWPDSRLAPPEDVTLLAGGAALSQPVAAPTTDDLLAMVMEKK